MIWRWFDQVYEGFATGQVNLLGDVTASLSTELPEDASRDVPTLDYPAPLALTKTRVSRAGADTGWAFGDLRWGPEVSVGGVRSVVVAAGGRQVAYLPLDKAYEVVNGTLSVQVPDPALLLGNRSA